MTTPKPITDEALLCFVRWCRTNEYRIVADPDTARRVLEAYRRIPETEKADAL